MSSTNNESKRVRRHFSSEQKVAIVKQHLIDGQSVADLCDLHSIQPPQFYPWQKTLFEQGATALRSTKKLAGKSSAERKIQQLEEKLATKNEVISERMEENVKAKKSNGEL